jgi:hypothetical protein
MELGARSIRSAGIGSGSIELTLPAALRDLLGVPCRILLREGLRPEIVLQPDLRPARLAFGRLWALLLDALGRPGAELPFGDIAFSLTPAPLADRPALAWADGLALAGAPPHPAEALARSLRGLAMALAGDLGIAPELTAGFAAAAAHFLSGIAPAPTDQAACDIAFAALPGARGAAPARPDFHEDAFAPALWAAASPGLRRLAELHQDWTADPARHAALAAAWRRGVALELSGD